MISSEDREIMRSNYDEIRALNEEYRKIAGESLAFNYEYFYGTEELRPAEQYLQVLRECVRTGTKHDYDKYGYKAIKD